MATKKAAKKAPAKKAAAKKTAKKATTKKVAAKSATKKVAKKAPAKKVAKKSPAKKVAKRTAKKTASARAAAPVVIPPVPVGNAKASAPINVDTKPAAVATASVSTSSAAKKSGSNRVVLAVVIGILAIGAIVLSKNSSNTESPTATPTATPTADASASATPTASESTNSAVTTTAAPLGIVAHYTPTGATIFWNKSTAADGIKGYSVEISSNGGSFSELAMVTPDVTKYDITKSDTTGWCSFKISAVYVDGQKAAGKVFGLPGQYK